MTQLLVAGAAVLVVDQLSKAGISGRTLPFGDVLRLHPVRTMRARFARRDSHLWYFLYWLMALVAAVFLSRPGLPFESSLSGAGLGAALGGAAGNLADMIRNRAVTDFIDLPWWPSFNIADAAIVAGIAAAFTGALVR